MKRPLINTYASGVGQEIRDNHYLVTVVDNTLLEGDLFALLTACTAVRLTR